MAETAVVSQLARIQSQPGKAETLRGELQTLEASTRQEPGCLEFTFYQAISNADEFVLIERFQNAQALQTHLDADYTRRFFGLGLVAGTKVQMICP